MKKSFIAICIASLSLFLSQCSENPTVGEEQNDVSKSIKIAIAIPPGLDTTISSAYVEVTADDMKTIRQKLSINYSSIYGVVKNVPAGYNRHFEVYVYGSKGKDLMYYGDSYANIYSGQETYVKIILRQPGGTAIIDGYIEGYVPPSDTIPTPGRPYIYDYQISPTNPPLCYSLTLATEGSYYFDSLYYIWNVIRIYNGDTTWERNLLGMALPIDFPKDGEYQVYVQAQSMYDSLNRSQHSDPLFFTIKNGLLTDRIISPDTTSPIITLYGPDTIILPLYSPYVEYGAKAYDFVDGNLTGNILLHGYFDSTIAGTYTFNYTVSDNAGNTATTNRIIIYTNSISNHDTVPPVITLFGPLTMYITPGDTFSEPGYKANDNIDGNITSKVQVSRQDFEDIIRIIYTVKDAAGNTTFVSRIINTMPPLSVINKNY
jgi:hypothetical protein